MDSEIRAIMAQYMPLDNQGDVPNQNSQVDDNIWQGVGKLGATYLTTLATGYYIGTWYNNGLMVRML